MIVLLAGMTFGPGWLRTTRAIELTALEAPSVPVILSGITETNQYEFYFTPDISVHHPWVMAETLIDGHSAGWITWTNALQGWGRNIDQGYFHAGLADDRDGDGLSDGFEVVVLKTDPSMQDSDGNGILDGDEDFDGDGKSNIEEYNSPDFARYNPIGGSSNPWHPDTDGDGVSDGPLAPPGWSLLAGPDAFPTDPAGAWDTDRDGRTDALTGQSTSAPALEEDDDGNKALLSEGFEALSSNWHATYLCGGNGGSHGLVAGCLRVQSGQPGTIYGVYHDEPVSGHFMVEVAFTNEVACGLGILQINNGTPDTNNFTSIQVGTNASGRVVVRVQDRQAGVDNVLDNTGALTSEQKAKRYTHTLTNQYSLPFDRTAGKIRIMRDNRSGFFHFYYAVQKEIRGEWTNGWMELAPSRCWGATTQAYCVVLYAGAEGVATASVDFDNLTVSRKQEDDRDDRWMGFQVARREYNWSGFAGDALVVTFGDEFPYSADDRKFVFWSRFNYVPSWHLDDQAHYSYEFCETWGGGNRGCHEPMSDRLHRWTQVDVLEDNPVRKVIHWHYVLCNPDYLVPDDDQGTQLPEGDEYWTLYPDGSAVRHICYTPKLDTSFREWNEVAELMVIADSTSDPDDHVASPALTIMNLEAVTDTFFPPVTQSYKDKANEWNQFIIMTHFQNDIDAFAAFSHSDDITNTFSGYKLTTDIAWHNPTYTMSHWPVGLEPYQTDNVTEGTWTGEVSHASLMGISAYFGYGEWTNNYKLDGRGRKYRDWTSLVGLHDADDLAGIRAKVRSWLYPGVVTMLGSNAVFRGVDYQQKALMFERTGAVNRCQFTINPSAAASTVINPVFEIEDWSSTLLYLAMDGTNLVPYTDYRYHADGTNLLVWLQRTFSNQRTFILTDAP
ncbi:MAG: hypothetical protein EOM20_08835 [Spartobacteria bacterium]|nr:hypothetical protein [Spartobacteria bacterium]